MIRYTRYATQCNLVIVESIHLHCAKLFLFLRNGENNPARMVDVRALHLCALAAWPRRIEAGDQLSAVVVENKHLVVRCNDDISVAVERDAGGAHTCMHDVATA